MDNDKNRYIELAHNISDQFKRAPQVEAIAVGGSQTAGSVDRYSDIDLYIYSNRIIPLDYRKSIVDKLGASRSDLNLKFWDLGDEWYDAETGVEVDIMYWDRLWVEEQIARVLDKHQASMGYSTCLWHTILNSRILFDNNGWLGELQNKCSQAYPAELRNAIIAKNHPVLRNVIPSYYSQIEKAIDRHDLISVNHRIAALLASYFDVLFAINYLTNAGEKKVLKYALEKCSKMPENLQTQIEDLLSSTAVEVDKLFHQLDILLDALDALLVEEGIDPSKTLFLGE